MTGEDLAVGAEYQIPDELREKTPKPHKAFFNGLRGNFLLSSSHPPVKVLPVELYR